MSAPAIQPIETRWMGWRFRSRCEARWAVFFSSLGVTWDYEPEGFRTSHGPYLPDFLATVAARWDRDAKCWTLDAERATQTRRFYVEIKDADYFDGRSEWDKWCEFAERRRRELLVVFGTPSLEARSLLISPPVTIEPCPFDDGELQPELVHHDRFARIATVAFPPATVFSLSRAIEAARGARFEHGECPSSHS